MRAFLLMRSHSYPSFHNTGRPRCRKELPSPQTDTAGPNKLALLFSLWYNKTRESKQQTGLAQNTLFPVKTQQKDLPQPQQLSKVHRGSTEGIKAASLPSSAGCR